MNNYDNLLREKDNADNFNDNSMEKHWGAMEKRLNASQQPKTKYRKLFRAVIAVAAVFLILFFGYKLFIENKQQQNKILATTNIRSAIKPPMKGLNVPYEIFSFNASTGDTVFTQNGSIIIFPPNAVLNTKGEIVTGDVQVSTREFNDPFDYSIAGIPMEYDSAGTKYSFISSGMIDISAYQNGELLQVNQNAKPQLNLVSTNKELKTSLYKLDTVSGSWINKGRDEVNLVEVKNIKESPENKVVKVSTDQRDETDVAIIVPPRPEKASSSNPVINVIIDPQSFKELMVYNGLKFEVTNAKTEQVEEDSKMEWDNILLQRGAIAGTYKVVFSTRNKTAVYNVKPVLEGKDFDAAEKVYQDKLREYSKLQLERKKDETDREKLSAQQLAENKIASIKLEAENATTEKLNKLISQRNEYIEARNKRIDLLNQANRDRGLGLLQQDLIRSFQIDGFGYWNCDQPSLPGTQLYTSTFKNEKNLVLTFNHISIALEGINRIENYSSTTTIGLQPNGSHMGWAFSDTNFYYFTKKDFQKAIITNNPNTVSITMTLYNGDVRDYSKMKRALFEANKKDQLAF